MHGLTQALRISTGHCVNDKRHKNLGALHRSQVNIAPNYFTELSTTTNSNSQNCRVRTSSQMAKQLTSTKKTWREKLPDAVGIGNQWRLDLVNTQQEFKEYQEYLAQWSKEAKAEIKHPEEFQKQRANIEETKTCTPENWTKAEELACVCDDLLEIGLAEHKEAQYLIYHQGEAVGAITLVEARHNSDGRTISDKEFTVTGLVKKMNAQGSLRACVPKFLSIILNKTGKQEVILASAKGAIGAYEKYGFTKLGMDAKHYGPDCGCTLLEASSKDLVTKV